MKTREINWRKDFKYVAQLLKFGAIGLILGLILSKSILLFLEIHEDYHLFINLIIPFFFWLALLTKIILELKEKQNPHLVIKTFFFEILKLVIIIFVSVTVTSIFYIVFSSIFTSSTYTFYGIFNIAAPIGSVLGLLFWFKKRYSR